MDSFTAFMMREMNRGKELMVFDWDKAAQIIKEQKPVIASAGLRSDWEWTGGTIYRNGKPIKNSYTYLSSTWAVPELELKFADSTSKIIDCYKMQHEVPEWDSDTKWPKSALAILNQQEGTGHAKTD